MDVAFRQAVAEGVSVFVATGDFGPTDCATSGNGTSFGIGVNGWAATQFNVAVGGTDFSDTFSGTNSQFWNATSTATFASAKSYVPEMAWNDTCASTLVAQFLATFEEFPPRQKAASFTIDQVVAKLESALASGQ